MSDNSKDPSGIEDFTRYALDQVAKLATSPAFRMTLAHAIHSAQALRVESSAKTADGTAESRVQFIHNILLMSATAALLSKESADFVENLVSDSPEVLALYPSARDAARAAIDEVFAEKVAAIQKPHTN